MTPIPTERITELISWCEGLESYSEIKSSLNELLEYRKEHSWHLVTEDANSLPNPGWWGYAAYYQREEVPPRVIYQGTASYSYHGGWCLDDDESENKVVLAWHNPLVLPEFPPKVEYPTKALKPTPEETRKAHDELVLAEYAEGSYTMTPSIADKYCDQMIANIRHNVTEEKKATKAELAARPRCPICNKQDWPANLSGVRHATGCGKCMTCADKGFVRYTQDGTPTGEVGPCPACNPDGEDL